MQGVGAFRLDGKSGWARQVNGDSECKGTSGVGGERMLENSKYRMHRVRGGVALWGIVGVAVCCRGYGGCGRQKMPWNVQRWGKCGMWVVTGDGRRDAIS